VKSVKLFVLTLLVILAVTFASGQSAPQYQVNLSFLTGGPYAQSSALDVSFGSQFTANNMLQGDFITMPAPSYTGYFGGDSYNLCGIKAVENLLASTSLSCGKFAPMLTGEVGLGRLDPTGGSTQQGLAGLAGIGIGYDPSGQGKFGLLFKGGWGHFGPTIAATPTAAALSGNGFYFYSGINFGGGSSSAATDAKIERMKTASAKKATKHLKSLCKSGDHGACDALSHKS
jgi:hypothetical protein